jgi:hypothetical protein
VTVEQRVASKRMAYLMPEYDEQNAIADASFVTNPSQKNLRPARHREPACERFTVPARRPWNRSTKMGANPPVLRGSGIAKVRRDVTAHPHLPFRLTPP